MPKVSKGALWVAIGVLAVVIIALYQHFGLGDLLTLESLKSSRDGLAMANLNQLWLALGLFFVSYVGSTALSIPGALVLTLAAGTHAFCQRNNGSERKKPFLSPRKTAAMHWLAYVGPVRQFFTRWPGAHPPSYTRREYAQKTHRYDGMNCPLCMTLTSRKI